VVNFDSLYDFLLASRDWIYAHPYLVTLVTFLVWLLGVAFTLGIMEAAEGEWEGTIALYWPLFAAAIPLIVTYFAGKFLLTFLKQKVAEDEELSLPCQKKVPPIFE
jgi:hypothetical protein